MADEVVWRPPAGCVSWCDSWGMSVMVAMGCLMQDWDRMDLDVDVPPTPARALRMFSVIVAVGFCVFSVLSIYMLS
jgi:hypothetical protein